MFPYFYFSPPSHGWAGSSSIQRCQDFLLALLSSLQLSGEKFPVSVCEAVDLSLPYARCPAEAAHCWALRPGDGHCPCWFYVALLFFWPGAVVSLVAFESSSLAWLKATGTALSLVCLTADLLWAKAFGKTFIAVLLLSAELSDNFVPLYFFLFSLQLSHWTKRSMCSNSIHQSCVWISW